MQGLSGERSWSAGMTVTRVLLWPVVVVSIAALLPAASTLPGSPVAIVPLDRFSLIFLAFCGLVAGAAIEGLLIALGMVRALERLAWSAAEESDDRGFTGAAAPYRGGEFIGAGGARHGRG
ncbi:MAG: hypothetical protein KAY22_02335 [Rhizorhabdus sp.]|nr:hypothetical protein [Rhizorhabdus sp.]